MREELNWEGMGMGEWLTKELHTQQDTKSLLDSHFNLVQCHLRNHTFLHSEPSARTVSIQYPNSSKAVLRNTNILNMNYVPGQRHLSHHSSPVSQRNVHWTKQEKRCLKELQEGFWVISAMEGSNAYVGTATDRQLQLALEKRRTMQPKWFERRNAILFDADVCGGLNLGMQQSPYNPFHDSGSSGSSPATSPRGSSPTSSSVLSSSPDTKLLIGQGMHLDSKVKQLTSSMFSMKLVAAGNDKNLVLFNLATGKIQSILQGHRQSVYACKALNERTIISAGTEGMMCLWDIEKGKLMQSIDSAHSAPIYGVEVEKNQCALTYSKDGFIKLWDFRSGNRLDTDPVIQLSIPTTINVPNAPITIGVPTTAATSSNPAPIYDADMYLTSIVAADREGTVAYWDVRNSTKDPCHVWRPVTHQENGMITGVSVDRGKVSVLTQSTSEKGDTVHVYETLTAAFAEISRWSEGHSRVGEKIIMRKGDSGHPHLMNMETYNEIFVPHKNGQLKCISL